MVGGHPGLGASISESQSGEHIQEVVLASGAEAQGGEGRWQETCGSDARVGSVLLVPGEP